MNNNKAHRLLDRLIKQHGGKEMISFLEDYNRHMAILEENKKLDSKEYLRAFMIKADIVDDEEYFDIRVNYDCYAEIKIPDVIRLMDGFNRNRLEAIIKESKQQIEIAEDKRDNQYPDDPDQVHGFNHFIEQHRFLIDRISKVLSADRIVYKEPS